MIPKFKGGILCGKDGKQIGNIIRRKLVVLGPRQIKWIDNRIYVCAFAVMEFGGLFDCLWVNDTTTGELFGIDTPDLRRAIVDGSNRHILEFEKDLKLLDADDIRLRVPGFTPPE